MSAIASSLILLIDLISVGLFSMFGSIILMQYLESPIVVVNPESSEECCVDFFFKLSSSLTNEFNAESKRLIYFGVI